MNLFVLDIHPVKAARQNCDSHVCKIILEAADMLCLSHWETGGLPPYAPVDLLTPRRITDKFGRTRDIYKYRAETQKNNHVAIWVRSSLGNYRWTVRHALALCDEYERRYADNLRRKGLISHASRSVIEWFAANEPRIERKRRTTFRQAVAEDCYNTNVVRAYRDYYVRYKARFAKWRLGNIPRWFAVALANNCD